MKRIHLLVSGTAALFILAGCQPSQNGGGTGATPAGMPMDTTTTDTTTTSEMTAAAAHPGSTKSGVVAFAEARLQE